MTGIGRRPTRVQELARAVDRISFLYVERCVIHRDSNAITATDERGVVHIPASAVGVLMLGPGTSVTHQAMVLAADSGMTIIWVGERGVRYYAHGTSLARSSRLLEAQAEAVTNQRSRLRVARDMYGMRFAGEDTTSLTMQQLRGREGARVRAAYRKESERTGVPWSRRTYDPDDWDVSDPINQALSAAHASLYGVVHAVIVALGCSPGLGFVHTGHHRSFVYDVADLYKAELSVPVAFDAVLEQPEDLAAHVRRRMRDRLLDGQLLSRCASDIRRLLLGSDPTTYDQDADDDDDVVMLWDDRVTTVAAGVSYPSVDVPW